MSKHIKDSGHLIRKGRGGRGPQRGVAAGPGIPIGPLDGDAPVAGDDDAPGPRAGHRWMAAKDADQFDQSDLTDLTDLSNLTGN